MFNFVQHHDVHNNDEMIGRISTEINKVFCRKDDQYQYEIRLVYQELNERSIFEDPINLEIIENVPRRDFIKTLDVLWCKTLEYIDDHHLLLDDIDKGA